MTRSRRPNVIHVLTDDQRAELLGCAGHPILETPNLDRLAAAGVRFENAFCTSPLCTPSRTCHYLGQWERRHGVNFNSGTAVSPESWTRSFPSRLREAGYFTGWVGKNHVPVGERGYDSGRIEESFDYWYGNHRHSRFYPKEDATEGGEIYENASADTQPEIFAEGIRHFLDPNRDGGDSFRSACPRELPVRPEDRPFCLCVTFNLPHNAATGSMQLRPSDPEKYVTRYRDRFDDVPLPPAYVPYYSEEEPKLPPDVYDGEWLPSYDYVRGGTYLRERLIRQYQTVSAIDGVVGEILSTLEEMDEAEDTIVVFSTDHGIMHGEHGLGGKAFLYDPAVRIPLLVYDPRTPEAARGQVRDELVAVPDIAPTVLDLADVDVPEAMQGRSLAPLVYGEESVDWREELFLEQLFDNQNYPMSEGLRTAEWKYVRFFERTAAQGTGPPWASLEDYHDRLRGTFRGETPVHEELYHLSEDPHEEANVAGEPEHRDTLERFRRRTDELAARRYEGEPETVQI